MPLVKDYYPPVSPSCCPLSPLGGGGAHQQRHLWIGEETKRQMPPHVYKYYLARTRSYRRQSLRVSVLKTL